MRIGQIRTANGDLHAVVVTDRGIVDVASSEATTVVDYISLARSRGQTISDLIAPIADRGRPLAGQVALAIPVSPPEVFGCGVTYKRSAEFRDEDAAKTTRGIYDYVYHAKRPEIFFKATATRCVGPDEPIIVRSDSDFTAPEPELALVLDAAGQIVGFTVADDVSAWDIERENPLYLPQSKMYQGCCSIGPVIVTPDEVGDANALELTCRIVRAGSAIFSGSVNTSQIGRTFAELIEFLMRDNPIPDGTVVCTGTGVIAQREHALREGDIVEIEIERIGRLANPVRKAAIAARERAVL